MTKRKKVVLNHAEKYDFFVMPLFALYAVFMFFITINHMIDTHWVSAGWTGFALAITVGFIWWWVRFTKPLADGNMWDAVIISAVNLLVVTGSKSLKLTVAERNGAYNTLQKILDASEANRSFVIDLRQFDDIICDEEALKKLIAEDIVSAPYNPEDDVPFTKEEAKVNE